MKKISKFFLILTMLLVVSFYACETPDTSIDSCGYHNGHELFKGPKGGCYYINDNGNKTYVDRSECDC